MKIFCHEHKIFDNVNSHKIDISLTILGRTANRLESIPILGITMVIFLGPLKPNTFVSCKETWLKIAR